MVSHHQSQIKIKQPSSSKAQGKSVIIHSVKKEESVIHMDIREREKSRQIEAQEKNDSNKHYGKPNNQERKAKHSSFF
jgi:hypothetical protein